MTTASHRLLGRDLLPSDVELDSGELDPHVSVVQNLAEGRADRLPVAVEEDDGADQKQRPDQVRGGTHDLCRITGGGQGPHVTTVPPAYGSGNCSRLGRLGVLLARVLFGRSLGDERGLQALLDRLLGHDALLHVAP